MAWRRRRLVMPVGQTQREQRLAKVTRTSATHFEEKDLGGVMFVPLIGAHGWTRDEQETLRSRRAPEPRSFRAPSPEPSISDLIAAAAEPLPDIDHPAFGEVIDRFANARVVLLSEASHGTFGILLRAPPSRAG